MKMIPAEAVRTKMNESGRNRVPFLFAVDFELSEGFFIEHPQNQQKVLFHCPLGGNIREMPEAERVEPCPLVSFPIGYDDYRSKLNLVMADLKRGDSFLTNLTIQTPIQTSLSLKQIALRSDSPYRLYVPGRFVCFSPERFVCIVDGVISTNPMKGTIRADVANAEAVILADRKETAEHATIVDLLRNDLGMVADDIRVERFRYTDRIRTHVRDIWQVSSEITGRLAGDYYSRLGDLIFRMLPAGSVSGAPKRATVGIIRKAEQLPRGFYTGVSGYFDGKRFDSAVLIRFIEESGGRTYYRSGGGITAFSDAEKEYKEVLDKIYLPFV